VAFHLQLADLQESIEPEEKVAPGTRRSTRTRVVNYASEEAMQAAGLEAEKEDEDDEHEEFRDATMDD
jgi:hypothetical protein